MNAHARQHPRRGFTLLELILSVAVLVAVIALLTQVMSGVERVWRGGASDAALARSAAIALDRIAADLAAAARGPLPGEPIPDAQDSGDSAPLLVVRPAAAAPIPAGLPPPDDVPGEEAEWFSRLAVLVRSPRPVWTDDETTLRPLRRPRSDADLRLRALLRVRYDAVRREDTAADDSEDAVAESALCHDLVRRVAGIRADVAHAADDGAWWKDDEAPEDFGTPETLIRNVVWFSVSVPDFLGVATNRTEAAANGNRVWGWYSTVSDDNGPSPEPLPPLVDVALGLVSDQTLSRAAAQSDDKRRDAILRQGLRVYVRRILLR